MLFYVKHGSFDKCCDPKKAILIQIWGIVWWMLIICKCEHIPLNSASEQNILEFKFGDKTLTSAHSFLTETCTQNPPCAHQVRVIDKWIYCPTDQNHCCLNRLCRTASRWWRQSKSLCCCSVSQGWYVRFYKVEALTAWAAWAFLWVAQPLWKLCLIYKRLSPKC